MESLVYVHVKVKKHRFKTGKEQDHNWFLKIIYVYSTEAGFIVMWQKYREKVNCSEPDQWWLDLG